MMTKLPSQIIAMLKKVMEYREEIKVEMDKCRVGRR